MQQELSSYMIVDAIFLEDKPRVSHTCWILDLNQTHLWIASCNAKIYAWLDDAVVMVCFTDHHEMVVPPDANKYPVCDLPLCGSDK